MVWITKQNRLSQTPLQDTQGSRQLDKGDKQGGFKFTSSSEATQKIKISTEICGTRPLPRGTPFFMLLGFAPTPLEKLSNCSRVTQAPRGQPGAELCFLACLAVPLMAGFRGCAGIQTSLCSTGRCFNSIVIYSVQCSSHLSPIPSTPPLSRDHSIKIILT